MDARSAVPTIAVLCVLLFGVSPAGCIEGASYEAGSIDTFDDVSDRDSRTQSDTHLDSISAADVVDDAGFDVGSSMDTRSDADAFTPRVDIQEDAITTPVDAREDGSTTRVDSSQDAGHADTGDARADVPAELDVVSPDPVQLGVRPTIFRGTARGGGFVLRPVGRGTTSRGVSSGGGFHLAPLRPSR